MKIVYILCTSWLLLLASGILNAQANKIYASSGGELIFSFADINNNGSTKGNILRFSPVINIQSLVNYDVSSKFGLYGGFTINNIGFIYDDPNTTIRKKYRTYNVGFPIGIKIGNLKKLFLFGGYSLEFPFNYKEKTFDGEEKNDKYNEWFSNRVPDLAHGLFVGIELPLGVSLKAKYYVNNFFNKAYTSTEGEKQVAPFRNFTANIFFISISFHLFRNTDFYYEDYYLQSN